MQRDLISVIIPVYNVKEYLEKALRSVMEQTYSEIEVILIDDGSSDGSEKMCDEYAEKDDRIVVVHKENGGPSSARNLGIEIARGKYITFVDSDDYIKPIMVETMYMTLKKYDVDCVQGRVLKVYEGRGLKEEFTQSNENVREFTTETALESMLYRKNVTSYACGKLFKKELFNSVRFPQGRLFEDLATMYKILAKCQKVVCVDTVLYYYVQRNNSIVNSSFSSRMYDWIEFCQEIDVFIEKNYPDIRKASISKLFMSTADLYRRVPQTPDNKEMINKLNAIMRKHRREVFLDKKGKIDVRILALVSCINVRLLRFLGKIYASLRRKGLS